MMRLPEWTASERERLERQSAARIDEGLSLLESARGTLNEAIVSGDHDRADTGLAALRRASAQLASGIAIHRALNERSAQSVAVEWLRDQSALTPVASVHGLFGLNWFHYSAMALLAAVAAALLAAQVFRVRRAAALAERLLAGADLPAPAPPVNPALAPTPSNAWKGTLRLVRVFQETAQVKSFRLADPAGGPLPFTYLPGQFLTIVVQPQGRTVRRSYTIASAPTRRDACEITVRREPEGVVSSFLHDRVREGDLLEIVAPSGRFTFVGEEASSIVLIAGGVGITPMMSVVRYLTDRAWSGQIYLLYGAKSDQDVIYRDELAYLAGRYPNLSVTVLVEEAHEAVPYRIGRFSAELLSETVPDLPARHIHLCGPPAMMSAVKAQLVDLGVPAGQIETEAFIGKERATGPLPVAPAGQKAAVARFVRSRKSAALDADKTLLEAAEDVGVDIDYACRAGVCGACKVKLLTGAVTMAVDAALTPEDRAQGIVLACQARAADDVTVDA